jgi:hypothetical protein
MLSAKASSPLALVSPLYLHRAFTWLLYLVTDQSLGALRSRGEGGHRVESARGGIVDRVTQELSTTRTKCMGIVLSGLFYVSALSFYNYW